MNMRFEGRVWRLGDHIDTDAIIPARFLNMSDQEILGRSCFIDRRPDFRKGVRPGDVIIAGSNFGCGSSREHAPIAIKACQVSVIVARSFARIFYRNAFNIGLTLLECEDAHVFSDGMRLSVDMATGELREAGKETVVFAKPIPGFMQEMIHAGGLLPYIRKKGSL